MEFPKDRCSFCEHTTRNAPSVTQEYLDSLRKQDSYLELVMDIENILSHNLDALLPIFKVGDTILFFGARKGNYCGIFDGLGNNLLGFNYTVIIPPFMTDKQLFVLKNKDNEWGAYDMKDPYNPTIVVPFGTYNYMWGFDSNHCLVSAKGIGKPGTFEGRGIINSNGDVVVGFDEYKDIWDFYNNRSGLIKAETFDGQTLHLLKRHPLHKAVNGIVYNAKSIGPDIPVYGSRFGEFSGTYAQDVAGLSDDVINDAFDGDPEAYWNID